MRRTAKTLVVALLALAGFFALGAFGAFRGVTAPLTAAVATIAAPIYRIGSAISRAGIAVSDGVLSPDALEVLTTENARLRALVAENEALKEALGYRQRFTDKTVPARVISPTAYEAFRGIIIDRGESDGVRIGQPVVTANGTLVGKVIGTRERTSSVLLLSDSRSKIAVTIQNETGTVGVLEGDRGLAMTISLIPLSESLAPGDTIVTSGLEPGIRRGLPIGTVESVSRKAQDPYQTASVAPFKSASFPALVQIIVSPDAE